MTVQVLLTIQTALSLDEGLGRLHGGFGACAENDAFSLTRMFAIDCLGDMRHLDRDY